MNQTKTTPHHQTSRAAKTINDVESEQLLKFWQRPAKSDHQKFQFTRNRMIIMIMLDAGLRISEVAKLTLDMILYTDKIAESITIPAEISKSKRSRAIPTSERLKNELLLYSAWWGPFGQPQSSQPVFPKSPGGSALTERTIQRIVGVASRGSIGRKIWPHVLRHTFGTKMMRIASARVVQELLGHANIATTQRYLHPDHQDLTDAIGKLGTNGKTQTTA